MLLRFMKSSISLSVVVNVQQIEYPTNKNVMKRELTVAMYGDWRSEVIYNLPLLQETKQIILFLK